MAFSSSSPSSLPRPQPALRSPGARRALHVPQRERRARQKLWPALRRNLGGYLFLLPALLIFALFVWYPIVLGFVMSFQNVDMINPARWVGLLNYRRVCFLIRSLAWPGAIRWNIRSTRCSLAL
jgi:multiple sugar transport system permease protein